VKILSKMKCRREILMKKRIDLNLESMSLTTMARMNIDGYKPKYTWKGHASYYFWGLNEIKSYFKQNNSSLFKTYATFSWFKAIAMWGSGMSNHQKKKEHTDHFPFSYIFLFILKSAVIFLFLFLTICNKYLSFKCLKCQSLKIICQKLYILPILPF
jgi:hypothetical protein